jgi:Tfp pilus assembly protein PilX
MNSITKQIRNEEGSMITVVVMILALLTISGIAAISTSNTEQQTATSEQIYKMAFFSAEAGRSYIEQNPDLYHEDNITTGGSLSYPDIADDTVNYNMWAQQSFNGSVEYIGSSLPPRGSGYEVGTYKSHSYRVTSSGYGPRNSENRVEAGFYRIGF